LNNLFSDLTPHKYSDNLAFVTSEFGVYP